jgi:Trk K+ transport system NAD-binding subunit
VLLVADVPIVEGSRLAGRPASDVYEPGEARVVAIIGNGATEGTLPPYGERILAPGDRIIIVATRIGLSHIVGRSARVEGNS